jgi:hypothetical protein
MLGIVLASVLGIGVLSSVGYLMRDLRTLHRGGRSLTDAGGDAAGVSPAGMTFIGNTGSH